MATDLSHGWNEIALEFIDARSDVGSEIVRQWAKQLPPGGVVVDVGCGSGVPISATLIEEGFKVFGIDASPALVAEFRRRFSSAKAVCETAETSGFFQRTFDGAVAIGLLFLLPADIQHEIIGRVAGALRPGGRFLFSAPRHSCEWKDTLTGRSSISLGEEEYIGALERASMHLSSRYVDKGGNYYFDSIRTPA